MLKIKSKAAPLNWGSVRLSFTPAIFGKMIFYSQLIADALSVFLSYWVALFIFLRVFEGSSPLNLSEYLLFSVLVSMLYVFFIEREGLYRREISLLNIKEFRGIFRVALYSAGVILAVSFYIRSVSLSRLTITMGILISPMVLYIQRMIFYKLHLLFHQKGYSRQKVYIYGAGYIGKHLAKRMFESPSLGYLPVAFLDDDETKWGQSITWNGVCPRGGVPVLGGMEELKSSKLKDISQVFIALSSATYEKNQNVVELCSQNRIPYAMVPHSHEKYIHFVEMFEIGGIPILRKRVKKVSWFYISAKRMIDFLISTFFLLMMSPFFIIFYILIKLDSPGPVIFKQKRVGYKGKEFSLYKFRTMHISAPKYAVTPKSHSDTRITKIGRWLRRTSLDELPQLFNVFRGDMSLVGPRPEMPFIVEQYTDLERQRLEAKPGITGVWQISAVRGEPIHANMEYDLFYIHNRSLLLDFVVMIKTMFSVIKGVGAF